MSEIAAFLNKNGYAIWIMGENEFTDFCRYMNCTWANMGKDPYIGKDEFNSFIRTMDKYGGKSIIFYEEQLLIPKEFTAKVPLIRWPYYKEESDYCDMVF